MAFGYSLKHTRSSCWCDAVMSQLNCSCDASALGAGQSAVGTSWVGGITSHVSPSTDHAITPTRSAK